MKSFAVGCLFGALLASIIWGMLVKPKHVRTISSDPTIITRPGPAAGAFAPLGSEAGDDAERALPESMSIANPLILEHLKMDVAHDLASTRLSQTIIDVLRITPTELRRVEQHFADSVAKIRETESQLAEVHSDENGDSFYHIPAFKDTHGEAIQKKLRSDLISDLGADRGRVLNHLLGADFKLSNFGDVAREIAFIDRGEENEAPVDFPFIWTETRTLNEEGESYDPRQLILSPTLLEQTYGHLYQP